MDSRLRIIEALLFSTEEPLTLIKMREILHKEFPVTLKELTKLLSHLGESYLKEERGFELHQIGGGFLLRTPKELSPYVGELFLQRKREKLTKSAQEILAIIAFKQPITRGEIEMIRKVDSTGPLHTLMERGLIEVTGRKEGFGRPYQYGTTKRFLSHFGLKSLQELQTVCSAESQNK